VHDLRFMPTIGGTPKNLSQTEVPILSIDLNNVDNEAGIGDIRVRNPAAGRAEQGVRTLQSPTLSPLCAV